MSEVEVKQYRREKDKFFQQHPHSPLLPQDREDFDGLKYYPYNAELDLRIEVDEFEDKDDIQMQTSTGDLRMYQRWGAFTFDVGDDEARLTIYFSPENGHFFLPFMDATTGKETYGSGRYMDIDALGNNVFHVDFNQAYSPFCAYNPGYSCPIPPQENRIDVRIEAGEKNFK